MGCRILDAGDDGACLYDSVSMTAFGPIFQSADHAEDFLRWLKNIKDAGDPRTLDELELLAGYSAWHSERCDDEGDLRDVRDLDVAEDDE